jgi:hypothetical protein
MTSFPPAAGQHFTAVGSLHTLTESVYRFPAAFMGLIGSFFTWHCCNFFLLQNYFSKNFHQGTIPVGFERTAKVGKIVQ